MTKVALLRCETYDREEVAAAVKKGIELLGGIEQFVRPGENILLKPNLLFGDDPSKCINTHPSVFSAAAQQFLAAGARVTFGDHPGFGSVTNAVRKTGLAAAAEQLHIELADFTNGKKVEIKNPLIQKTFTIADGALEADGIVSLPKLKTHGLERITGAVKNQFGCVPGLAKSAFHIQYPDARDFGKMLLDLNHYLSPRLYIMDGIMGMEGNGPRGGDPVRMNVLIFAADPIALDATFCRLIDLDPEIIPTITFGYENGMGSWKKEDIELTGDDFRQFVKPDFHIDRGQIHAFHGQGPFSFLTNLRVPKPYIRPEKCVRCGVCVEACPARPKALHWTAAGKKQPPAYNYGNCIRCYCCQEMCPESAIHLRKPLLAKRRS
jgi:uncharacterized protein (DUF362 family)/Pyruvate/2-oxoacid:ferredoxin oxidoreductase delta subunit